MRSAADRAGRVPAMLLLAGATAVVVAIAWSPASVEAAARFAWPPFVLVAGLLLIGVAAQHDGSFQAAARLLAICRGGEAGLYAASVALVAVTTALLNLDTAVAFLTPVLVATAHRRGYGHARLLYAAVFVANAGSLILPGANLTNLLVLQHEHVAGAVFAARMAPAWVAAVAVTALAVWLLAGPDGRGPAVAASDDRYRPGSGLAATALATATVLASSHPALPVLAIGLLAVAWPLWRGELDPRTPLERVDVASLAGVFLVATALGTLARAWHAPARLMAHSGAAATAAIAATTAVAVNNLPAAVLLGSATPPHPRALLIGLDVGPNLAVTGSLSALLWWQAARSAGAAPSIGRYTLIGLASAPAAVAAAITATALLAPGRL